MTKHRKTTTRTEPPEGTALMPAHIMRTEFIDAISPALARLGISFDSVLRLGFTITCDAIEGFTCAPLYGVDAISSASIEGEDPDLCAIWVWPFRVEVKDS